MHGLLFVGKQPRKHVIGVLGVYFIIEQIHDLNGLIINRLFVHEEPHVIGLNLVLLQVFVKELDLSETPLALVPPVLFELKNDLVSALLHGPLTGRIPLLYDCGLTEGLFFLDLVEVFFVVLEIDVHVLRDRRDLQKVSLLGLSRLVQKKGLRLELLLKLLQIPPRLLQLT